MTINNVHIPFPNTPRMITGYVNPETWNLVSGTTYSTIIVHNLNTYYPIIQLYAFDGVSRTLITNNFSFSISSLNEGVLQVDVNSNLILQQKYIYYSIIGLQEGVI